jgi:hypothetical protein
LRLTYYIDVWPLIPVGKATKVGNVAYEQHLPHGVRRRGESHLRPAEENHSQHQQYAPTNRREKNYKKSRLMDLIQSVSR